MVLHWHLPILAYNIGFHGMEPSEESGPDTGAGGEGRGRGNNENRRRAKIGNESETLPLALQKQGFLRDCYEQWDACKLGNLHEMNEFLERQKL